MKNRFPGHYRPSADQFAQLWANGLFVPDTNILLRLFRYGEKTRRQVIETLQRLKPRVWIPYRVGYEFQRRWRDVDQNNRDAYDKLSRDIEGNGRALAALFDQYTRHQMIDAKQEQSAINDFSQKLCARLDKNKSKHPTREDAEAIFHQISDLIGDAVGLQPSTETMEQRIKEGQKRYEQLVPPGYRDGKDKPAPDKFGDFFIWKEILEKSADEKKPVIMITDDVKDDWWQEFRGAKIGPRPELIEELLAVAGQRFHIYTLSQFLDYASGFLQRKIDSDAIEEIKSDENQQREVARRTSEHTVPRAFIQQFDRQLRAEQRALRQRLGSIEAEIKVVNELASDDELRRAQSLIHERASTIEMLKELRRKLVDLRVAGNPYLRDVAEDKSDKIVIDLLKWLKSRLPPQVGNSDEDE